MSLMSMSLLNGKFSKGQYTYKIYHLASKVPGWIKMIAQLVPEIQGGLERLSIAKQYFLTLDI